jgi:hypothetical protein
LAVTATESPNVYRVSFPLQETGTQKSEIVAFVRVTESGHLEINYSHHATQHRTVPTGPWSESSAARFPLNATLVAILHAQVALALLDHFVGRVRVLPAPIGTRPEVVAW